MTRDCGGAVNASHDIQASNLPSKEPLMMITGARCVCVLCLLVAHLLFVAQYESIHFLFVCVKEIPSNRNKVLHILGRSYVGGEKDGITVGR